MIAVGAVEYRLWLLLAGCTLLLVAWVPAYTSRRPMSVPIVIVIAGALLFAVPGMPSIDPRQQLALAEHLTEFGVIVALLGAGLKLDRRIGVRRWSSSWRLLGIAMPISIAATALLGWGLAGLTPAAALLLAAVLAPTDPVLAADVQVGEPSVEPPDDDATAAESSDEPEDEVRFALTSEAGLNDGLAFPFVYAAIAVASQGHVSNWFGEWLLIDMLGRVVIGVGVGVIVGRVLGRAAFDPPWRLSALADAGDGFVALAATLLAYSAAELVNGYGFLAVFVAAVALRDSERGHSYHRVLHNFAGQVEQLAVALLLVVLGGSLASGLLSALTWRGACVGILLLMAVRPATGLLAMIGAPVTRRERGAIAFFGIRGVGSIYYLAFALSRAEFADIDELWAIVTFTILASIVVHGVTATPVMDYLDHRSKNRRTRRALMDPAVASQRAEHGEPG